MSVEQRELAFGQESLSLSSSKTKQTALSTNHPSLLVFEWQAARLLFP